MPVNLFDANFYRAANPDLAAAGLTTNAQVLSHFQTFGLNEGRSFSPLVNLNFYRASNPDLATAGLTTNQQLYDHLRNTGVAEGRKFSEFAELNFYLATNADVNAAFAGNRERAFDHLRNNGVAEGRHFSPFVNLNFYLAANADVNTTFAGNRVLALQHLEINGLQEGREFSQFFNINYYRSFNPDLVNAGLTGSQLLQHFEQNGLQEGRSFSVPFDINYYRSLNPDLTRAGLNNRQAYEHFQLAGLNEGRTASPFFNVSYYLNNNSDLRALGFNNQQAYDHFVRSGLREGRVGSNFTGFDYAGNSFGTARNIALGNTTIFRDLVGNSDISDLYRFNISTSTNFSLLLYGLSADANVSLFNSNGGLVNYSINVGTAPESINITLSADTYYIQVATYDNINTSYNLTLSSTSFFSSNYGYGLVDASAAVARAIGQTPFSKVTNLGGNNSALDMVNAPEAWFRGYTGQGIVVAVIDTGVDYNHPDLDANIWTNTREIANNSLDDDRNGYVDDIRGWDFVYNDNLPLDFDGHGTHVAGTIAAENNDFGVTGVAYNARIMPVRVLDAFGEAQDAVIAAGIRYAVDNGANVINLSLGGLTTSQVEADAVRYATERGAVLVMAAGNDTASQPDWPARYATRYGIAVGAVIQDNILADFSNRAGTTQLDYVVAPGVGIYSTVPPLYYTYPYDYKDGTSMATPHVSGVAALMLSANRSLTPAQVESILTATANPTGITV